jgi:hypothetical protein
MNDLVEHLFRRQAGLLVSTLTRILGPRLGRAAPAIIVCREGSGDRARFSHSGNHRGAAHRPRQAADPRP